MPSKTDIAQSLLSRAHSPDTASRIYTEKVVQRPLHLKPSHPTTPNTQLARRAAREAKNASQQREKRLKPKPLSSRQKRSLCLYDIPRSSQKYALYVPLHNMWLGYIREVLSIDEQGNGADGKEMRIGSAVAANLCSADYHGAELEVVRSRCVSRVGVRGIVVKDSKFAFEIVTARDKVKICPKEGTVFKFVVPRPAKVDEVEDCAVNGGPNNAVEVTKNEGTTDGKTANEATQKIRKSSEGKRDLVFELHGDQFIYRAADRTNKKFKTHFLPDL